MHLSHSEALREPDVTAEVLTFPAARTTLCAVHLPFLTLLGELESQLPPPPPSNSFRAQLLNVEKV